MAEILSTLGWLALGIAIGWWIKRRFFAPVFDESEMARLSREWGQHLAEHAERQKASVVWTAPDASKG